MFINSAAAGGDSGTFEAAKEKGFYTSGQDVDLTDPENPYIFPLRSRIPISLSGT